MGCLRVIKLMILVFLRYKIEINLQLMSINYLSLMISKRIILLMIKWTSKQVKETLQKLRFLIKMMMTTKIKRTTNRNQTQILVITTITTTTIDRKLLPTNITSNQCYNHVLEIKWISLTKSTLLLYYQLDKDLENTSLSKTLRNLSGIHTKIYLLNTLKYSDYRMQFRARSRLLLRAWLRG